MKTTKVVLQTHTIKRDILNRNLKSIGSCFILDSSSLYIIRLRTDDGTANSI